MKALFCLLILYFSCFNIFCAETVFAATTYYAQIVTDDVYFYSTPNDTESSLMFILPKTYFVEILSVKNEYYYARYSDVYGYVKKAQVKIVVGTPINPFLDNISFRVFVPSGANLRTSPYNLGANNLIYSIPFLETNLQYYGVINGEESISKKGTVWYYCKYYVNNLSYTGYVYAPLCDYLTPIINNTEILEYLNGEPQFENQNSTTITQPSVGISPSVQTIIIVAVSLPCLLFIYLLFKPTKIAETTKSSSSSRGTRNHKKINRLKRSDYFEIDDDFN